MTETGRIFCDCVEPRHVDTRAFGRPRNGLQVRIVDHTDRDVAPDQEGKLIVRFTGLGIRKGFFAGYLKNEKETELAWRGGWFHTGDVVIQDADGVLRFVDRMKNIVRNSGENISAAEVEAVSQEHENVAQAAIVAVPDEIREEEVLACVVPLPGVEVAEAFAHELIDWCLTRLAYFKAPGYLIFFVNHCLQRAPRRSKSRRFSKLGSTRGGPQVVLTYASANVTSGARVCSCISMMSFAGSGT